MSASLVRKALDETSFTTDGKLEQLSKSSKKKFKPKNKRKKLSSEEILKQNLKVLKALEYKAPARKQPNVPSASSTLDSKNSKKGKKKKGQQSESVFTEEDFEKFEKEYFVS